MSDAALYRKYRPSSFDDIRGQDHVVRVFENALADEDVSHAYLFSGKRGTGKTSIARILATELGCSDKDIYEMDAASNRRIDDVRELREAVRSLPFESPYKVYIIDEVHMLTNEAFNALLKTLEEPPEHAIFVLATTEMHKLPDTVISRCEVHQFKQPNQTELAEMIVDIAKKEGYKIEQPAAELIALLGDGSFRDALGVLQKVLRSTDGDEVDIEEVETITGAPKTEVVNSIIRAISRKDLDAGLTALNEAVENNIDMEILFQLLLQKIRYVLLLRYADDLKKQIEASLSEEDFVFLKDLSTSKKSGITSRVLKELLHAYNKLDRSAVAQLPLELALISIIGNNDE